ncbi:MAG TPA: antitoxin VapB family protein [Verrucomicrobiae bacterium]|jgi:predicted CopG family antitoxin
MASHTINLSDEAYKALKQRKISKRESFSEVILRDLPPPCNTVGELVERLDRDYPVIKPKRKLRRAA